MDGNGVHHVEGKKTHTHTPPRESQRNCTSQSKEREAKYITDKGLLLFTIRKLQMDEGKRGPNLKKTGVLHESEPKWPANGKMCNLTSGKGYLQPPGITFQKPP